MTSNTSEQKFEQIIAASEANDVAAINAAVMQYLLALLSADDQGSKTCAEIALLDRKLRQSDCALRCVARTAAPPEFCARTHRNEPLDYYLQLANGNEELRILLAEEQVDEAENERRLDRTGLRVRDRHEERKSAPHLKLPADLDTSRNKEMSFNGDSLAHFAPTVDAALLVRHATAIAHDTLSDDLCGTMVESLRFCVPVQQWPEARDSLNKTIDKRLPFAQQQTAVPSIRQDLIPLGFHALGTTRDRTFASKESSAAIEEASSEFVLVDLYAWQVRRFYVTLAQSVVDRLEASADDVSALLEPLAVAAGVADCELENIKTLADVERNFVISTIEKKQTEADVEAEAGAEAER